MMDNYPSGMSRSDLIHVGEIAEPREGRLDWLRSERAKALDEIDQVNDYINELDDEIQRLEFGDE
ncbi:hypothetical protein [Leuconostoc lactis]|uniref:hypothetical protein n=1 Tax=Leuconostoc lactis TaxID=1246 RepID=UPI0025AF3A5F|nr:hypothetical protein [Leuconostoc lactis]MDN2649613.1 hypothetical protein [Leuconostoc lactis]